jgi:TonB-dependent SusC/RagA subfamily outer membrane receptor
MKIKLFVLLLLSVVSVFSISAQNSNKKVTITGTVLDAAQSPMANAIIMVDGQKTSSMTDVRGAYKIKVKPTASKLGIFSFGSGIIEQEINGRTQIDFTFGKLTNKPQTDPNNPAGEQATDVGYGEVKKKYTTSEVKKIDGTNKKYASYSSIYNMIEREVSGVRFNGSSLIIQGSKDLFGDVSALIVVDGVPMDAVPDIPPTSVKSIEVLKGAAASIYGSRGYGGVLVIKTKIENE